MIYLKEIQKSYYTGIPQFCIGNKEECSVFIDDGSIRIPWGQALKAEWLKQIEYLALLPTEKQVKSIDKYRESLDKLSNLKKLITPVELFDDLNKNSFSWKVLDIWKLSPFIKNKKHSFLSLYFDHLLSLTINDTNRLYENFEIQNDNVPVLEYIETPVHENGFTSIRNLSSHGMIKHMILRNCKSQELTNLEGKFLKTLGITNFSNSIDVLKKINSLEVLYFNTIRSEIDWNIFLELPILKEINILNSKKLINLEALLECKNLESIYLYRCNNLLKDLEERFKNKNYKYLNIDYC